MTDLEVDMLRRAAVLGHLNGGELEGVLAEAHEYLRSLGPAKAKRRLYGDPHDHPEMLSATEYVAAALKDSTLSPAVREVLEELLAELVLSV